MEDCLFFLKLGICFLDILLGFVFYFIDGCVFLVVLGDRVWVCRGVGD